MSAPKTSYKYVNNALGILHMRAHWKDTCWGGGRQN